MRRRIAPGAYVDEEGTLHLDLAEMCEAAGVAPTAENQDRLERAAREMMPDAEVAVVGADG